MEQEVKLEDKEYHRYETIKKEKRLSPSNAEYIAHLHAKYYKHTYYFPCSCSKSTWQQWVDDINKIYERGY
jgi:hypothetical protein